MTYELSEGEQYEEITIGSEGGRIDRVLSLEMGLSRSQIQRLLGDGRITHKETGRVVENKDAKASFGEVYGVCVPSEPPVTIQKEAMDLDIIFEDACLVVLNKPAGIVVHPAPGHVSGTLVNGLLGHVQGLSTVGGVKRPGIVHRLDKDTSGLIVVAKTDEAHDFLSVQLKNHTMGRIYQTLVAGLPKPSYGWIEAPIGRHPRIRQKQTVTKEGRFARTFYKVKALVNPSVSYVICRLDTGRTHQIRVHMAHLGFPVLGDPLYGRKTPSKAYQQVMQNVWPRPYQALHAGCLFFIHPMTQKKHTFYAALPKTWHHLNLKTLDGQQCHDVSS